MYAPLQAAAERSDTIDYVTQTACECARDASPALDACNLEVIK